ncbi:Retrotransposase [Fusarium oxysporum f. sp. albedinis]|nr:Retrotransposase [Fusarium oxysporum f. sp. albedinis]
MLHLPCSLAVEYLMETEVGCSHQLLYPELCSATYSMFFTHNGPGATFPSADQVRVKSEAGDHVLDRKNTVIFESLGLVVKLGKEPCVTVAEGQCLWWLREVFLYMQLVEGVTLEKIWESLNREDKTGICDQLRDMVVDLRQVKRDSNDEFLGQINRGPLQDVVFADAIRPRAGPFSSVKECHDWLSFLFKRLAASGSHWEGYELEDIPDPYRQLLHDDRGVVFTHADLHQSNIIKGRNHYIHSTLDQIEWMYDFLGNYIVDVTHIRPEWNGCTHVDL